MFKKLFCRHSFVIDMFTSYMSVSDEVKSIPSVKVELKCYKCGKEINIYDKWGKNLKGLIK